MSRLAQVVVAGASWLVLKTKGNKELPGTEYVSLGDKAEEYFGTSLAFEKVLSVPFLSVRAFRSSRRPSLVRPALRAVWDDADPTLQDCCVYV